MVPYSKMKTHEGTQAWRQVRDGEVFGEIPGCSLPTPEAGLWDTNPIISSGGINYWGNAEDATAAPPVASAVVMYPCLPSRLCTSRSRTMFSSLHCPAPGTGPATQWRFVPSGFMERFSE